MKKKKYNPRDYHTFTTQKTTKKDRRLLNVGDLWMNSIQCLKCKEIIISNNLHDFRYCKCGSVFVDGGSWYGKAGGEIENIKLLYEQFDEI